MAASAPRWKSRIHSRRAGSLASTSLYPPVILVACREAVVRNMSTLLMEMEGNLVLSASNAWEALGVSRMFKGTIDLAVTDADLPGLGCADLCGQLLEERPGIKVLVLSATGSKERLVDDSGLSGTPALFDAETLRAKVRAIAAAPALPFPYVYMMYPRNPPGYRVHESRLPLAAEDGRERTRHPRGIDIAI